MSPEEISARACGDNTSISEGVRTMSRPDRAKFDPGDPFDAMAEAFRAQVAEMVIDARDIAIFRDLSIDRQFQCIAAGVMTGLIGVLYSFTDEASRPYVREVIRNFVDDAGLNAEGILANAPDP